MILKPDLTERKRILQNICRSNKKWKTYTVVKAALILLAAAIIFWFINLLTTHPTSSSGILIFGCVGLVFACIPVFAAISINNKAKYRCGFPYSSYANGFLILTDDSLEYRFWQVGIHEPAAYSSSRAVFRDEDKFSFIIRKNDIISLKVRNDICYIKGNGKLTKPLWACENPNTKEPCNEFSFTFAFGEINSEKIIKDWQLSL